MGVPLTFSIILSVKLSTLALSKLRRGVLNPAVPIPRGLPSAKRKRQTPGAPFTRVGRVLVNRLKVQCRMSSSRPSSAPRGADCERGSCHFIRVQLSPRTWLTSGCRNFRSLIAKKTPYKYLT